jgi:hypothetical protein
MSVLHSGKWTKKRGNGSKWKSTNPASLQAEGGKNHLSDLADGLASSKVSSMVLRGGSGGTSQLGGARQPLAARDSASPTGSHRHRSNTSPVAIDFGGSTNRLRQSISIARNAMGVVGVFGLFGGCTFRIMPCTSICWYLFRPPSGWSVAQRHRSSWIKYVPGIALVGLASPKSRSPEGESSSNKRSASIDLLQASQEPPNPG